MMKAHTKDIPEDLAALDDYLAKQESEHNLKDGTEARIIWNSKSKKEKTEYSIVYLHGFRASHPEGDPVHREIAKAFGCNLFLSRLEEHGIDSEYPLLHLTEEKLLQSARFAFEIGRQIGRNVILMGTSTGGSLALWLASQAKYKNEISSLILYSPLIRFYGIKEKLLMNPFARGMLRVVPGPKYLIKTKGTTYAEDRIWNKEYTLQGALTLGAFIEHYMKDQLFSEIHSPVFIGYYYKNKKEQDQIVSVPAIKKLITKLDARTEFLTSVEFPEANNHVICSSLLSRAVSEVIKSTKIFLKDVASHVSSENGQK